MGFVSISNVFKSVSSIIKPLAQTAIKAIAPQAADMLKNVIGSGFDVAKGAVSKFLSVSPFGNTINKLIEKLAPKGLDALKNLANGGIDKLLQMITGQPTPRTTSDGVTVTPPPLTQPGRTEAIANNTPQVSQNQASATGSGGPTSGGRSTSGDALSTDWGWKGGPPDHTKYNLKDPADMARFQADMTLYQTAMNSVNNVMQMKSNIEKNQSDAAKALISNFR